MSKFIKFAVAGIALVAIFSFVSAKADVLGFGSATLKKGSSGMYVTNLQTVLNSYAGATLVADGSFGPMTETAVKAFQASHGLTADGVVGNMTKASLTSIQSAGGVYPPGCTSNSGYSSTTGASCAGSVSNVPGCMPGYLFSSTTGASCSGSSSNNNGVAGNINSDTAIGGFANEQVGVGDSNHQIFGDQIKASGGGSNVTLTAATLQFVMNPTNSGSYSGSGYMNRYFSGASLWLDGTQVGSANASDFSQDTNSSFNNYVFTKTISLSGASIVAGSQANLYVAVSALPVIDSADYASNIWRVTLSSIRFSDGTGASLTYTPSNQTNTFSFASNAVANTLELDLARAASDMKAHVVDIDSSSNTEAQVLMFNVKAVGQKLHINKIPVTFTANDASSGSTTDLYNLANTVYLYNGSTLLDSETVASTATGTTAITFKNFPNGGLDINGGASVDLTVKASVNPIGTGTPCTSYSSTCNYIAGATLSAAVANTINTWDVLDGNGNSLPNNGTTNKVVGSGTGESIAFYDKGIMVDPISVSTSVNSGTSTGDDVGTFTIAFKVTSFGSTVYLPTSVGIITSTTVGVPANSASTIKEYFGADRAGTILPSTATTSAVMTDSGPYSPSLSANSNYVVNSGTSENFTMTITAADLSTTTGLYRAYLAGLKWDTADSTAGSTTWNIYNFNVGPTNAGFTSGYINLN